MSVPPAPSEKVCTALGPASATTSWFCGEKLNEKGTLLPSAVTVGLADSCPPDPTEKTSIELVLALVVTSNSVPSGLKPISPGDWRKLGGFVLLRPSDAGDPGSGKR